MTINGESAPAPHVDPALVAEAHGVIDGAVELRRRIHRRPETGLDLPVTQEAILESLDGLGYELGTGTATTSVVATLDGDRPGPTTLLRADMDALEMPEDTELEFASTVDGKMHACGHDAHVAMLAGAARLLAAHREELPGRVVLMFQPGEEGFGGARVMIDEGLLRRPRPRRPGLRHPRHAGPPVRPGRLPARHHDGLLRRVPDHRHRSGRPRLDAPRRHRPGARRLRDRHRPAGHGDPGPAGVRSGRRHRHPDRGGHGLQRHPGVGDLRRHHPVRVRRSRGTWPSPACTRWPSTSPRPTTAGPGSRSSPTATTR